MAGGNFFQCDFGGHFPADVAICYYVSGYIARRIDNQRKCTSCKKLLISSNTSSEVTESLFEEH